MFNLPENYKKVFRKDFPNIKLKFIDDPYLEKYADNVFIYWGTRFQNDYFSKFKNLRWIHFGSVGVDKIDYNLIKNKKNLSITNSKGINSSSMIELILLYLIDASRLLLNKKTLFKTRSEYESNFLISKNLKSIKILILGYGDVTKQLLPVLRALGIDFDILSNQRKSLRNIKFYKYKKLGNIANCYDIIINNLPINKLTKNIFNISIFDKLKKNISIISCGRHGIFNVEELFKFLYKYKSSFLYIDAPTNDKKKSNQLIKISRLKNVYISPHIGGYCKDYWPKQYQIFSDNLKLFIKNRKLKNQISFKKENFL